jgi:GNAT superfamily N-acetyltransferase
MLTEANIQRYEERSFNAWPALQSIVADGWLLRFAQGHTKRANSVNALSSAVALDTIVDVAEPLYRQFDLPLVFRLTPLVPARFDAELEQRGFASLDPTLVMTRRLDAPVAADPAVSLTERATPDWLHGVDEAAHLSHTARQTHRAMLAALRLPAVFATLVEDGVPQGYGFAVYERESVGLFDVVTLPHVRRRGVSSRLCKTLLAWGRLRGAREGYLQVTASNHGALALYRNLGFASAYPYHYRVLA